MQILFINPLVLFYKSSQDERAESEASFAHREREGRSPSQKTPRQRSARKRAFYARNTTQHSDSVVRMSVALALVLFKEHARTQHNAA